VNSLSRGLVNWVAGEWRVRKHGYSTRRTWPQRHLAMDAIHGVGPKSRASKASSDGNFSKRDHGHAVRGALVLGSGRITLGMFCYLHGSNCRQRFARLIAKPVINETIWIEIIGHSDADDAAASGWRIRTTDTQK
jgi:hypothetical protein